MQIWQLETWQYWNKVHRNWLLSSEGAWYFHTNAVKTALVKGYEMIVDQSLKQGQMQSLPKYL